MFQVVHVVLDEIVQPVTIVAAEVNDINTKFIIIDSISNFMFFIIILFIF
ncbi:hypothetical protein HOF65_02675 [bacterium]|nr:hypothetical protein [bacterium]MBT3852905.1 hypothetical protein [bacterium]MBT4633787.1 hypothetical protein [bacterium]MBT6779507.1 hypothetical protein [bacterium]